jgi:hypothetical protein
MFQQIYTRPSPSTGSGSGLYAAGNRQPERLVCQNPKTFLQTGRYASKTIRMQKESLRETNFEATVTRFEFPRRKVLDPGGAQQNSPGSHGNPKETQGCEGTGCPFPRKAVLRSAPGSL